MPPPPRESEHWSRLLASIAAPALADFQLHGGDRARIEDVIASFRDEAGHRRAFDAPFLSAAFGVPHHHPLDARCAPAPARAWDAVANASGFPQDLHDLIARVTNSAATGLSETDARMLTGLSNTRPGSQSLGIEPVTEALLCLCDAAWAGLKGGLHPNSDLSANAKLGTTCAALRDHLLAEYQPDNATSRPWAIGVFLDDWCRTERYESLMYADGMLTACRVQTGRPDLLSAVILNTASAGLLRQHA